MKFIVYLGCLLLLLSGCASSNIASNKSPDFNEKISRVYLVIHVARGATEFSYSFKTQFLQELSARGITSDYSIDDPLALESENALAQKIAKFNPQVVMVMNQTEASAYSGYNVQNSSNLSGGTFNIKLLVPGSDKPVWRANLEAYGAYGIEGSINKSVRKLVEQLKADRLI